MAKKKKISKVQIVRRISQAVFFILLPGLFISIFSSIKSIYLAILQQTFHVQTLLGPAILLFFVLLITVFSGRFFCGFLCSFGAVSDLVWFITKKISKKRLKINSAADRALKYVKYLYLIFVVACIWTFGWVTFSSDVDPWNIFGMLTAFWNFPATSYLLTIGFALFVFFMAGSFFIERFFCRYFCPLGAFLALISRGRILKLKKRTTEKCGSCRVCSSHCPMGIPLYQMDTVKTGECIDCFQCVDACPRGNMALSIAGKDVAPLLAGAVAVTTIAGAYYLGNIATENIFTADPSASGVQSEMPGGQYTNGTYIGSGTGYIGEVQVSVTVTNGNISDIAVLSSKDTDTFFSRAFSIVTGEILDTQSVEVDVVSGATFSSNGIIEAVADALAQARVDEYGTESFSSSSAGPEESDTAEATPDRQKGHNKNSN